MTADLATAGRLGAAEHWLVVVATTRADGSVHASLVNAGILDHPVTGEPTIGLVARGDARKLAHFRRTGRATVVFRSGWQWVAVDGPASICGPDDEMDGIRAGGAPGIVARRVPCRRWHPRRLGRVRPRDGGRPASGGVRRAGAHHRQRLMPTRPNVLVVMTDEERYPPPYESDAVADFRRTQLPGRERIRARGVELHRHYACATACTPSRASLFTGQYPSLHGLTSTDGLAKTATDPAMTWLDPATVPTLGDWFRAAGYDTYYRGKWHISHADLAAPGTHDGLRTNDAAGTVLPGAVDLYDRADRLDGYGFHGWIGREPHGADPSDTGVVRDPLFAAQMADLFADLTQPERTRPWLAVASFVNPHDIAFAGPASQLLGLPPPDDTVPDYPAAPSQADSLDRRPRCQGRFRALWPKVIFDVPSDDEYRRLYLWLHKLVDPAIVATLDALDGSGAADETIVVFTSDHGDLVGAHGGLQQKWFNAYDEAVRVPMVIAGPRDREHRARVDPHESRRPAAHAARADRRRRRRADPAGRAAPHRGAGVPRARPEPDAEGPGRGR